jgi:hypothetical protein
VTSDDSEHNRVKCNQITVIHVHIHGGVRPLVLDKLCCHAHLTEVKGGKTGVHEDYAIKFDVRKK